MIVSPINDQLQLIRQHDHAGLSGLLAQSWGNHAFQPLTPFASVVLAAALHDNGWQERDADPRVHPASHSPYQFFELPVQEHLTFYLRGVERVIAQDRYAGLLVSMHCQGLYNGRYGTDPSLMGRRFSPEEQQTVQSFLERLQRQQQQLREQLQQGDVAPADLRESRIWTNYKLLQIFDRLSLYLCMPPLRERTLGPVPVNEGQVTDLLLRPLDAGTVAVTPYPFRENPPTVTVEARRIAKKQYSGDEELRQELARAGPVALTFTLQAP